MEGWEFQPALYEPLSPRLAVVVGVVFVRVLTLMYRYNLVHGLEAVMNSSKVDS